MVSAFVEMVKGVTASMEMVQGLQDSQGAEHPGETNTYTFMAPLSLRLWLRLRRYEGLTFERYQGHWWGIFRAVKR